MACVCAAVNASALAAAAQSTAPKPTASLAATSGAAHLL